MGHRYPKLTLDALRTLLHQRFEEGFLSLKDLPHPSAFKDMEKATERIVRAIYNKEKITLIGDYDVDGVVSTTIMILFFEEIGYPLEWIIPNRFTDGYGLSANIVPRIKGTDLAITVDNGIAAVEAAKLCKAEGIELIITDHHIVPSELPEAYAIVDQKQEACSFPFKEVCGAQIAWYLAASLKNALEIDINMMEYMELAAIAIIADVMPLQHINRAMVIAGLKSLSKSSRPAVRAFKEKYEKRELTAEDIGFFLAPLLNSAGRMDDASHAVAFLSSKNIYDARVRLERLQGFNTLRKETEEKITREALKEANCSDDILVLAGEGWHEGVVGIVAARVARIHEKPTIILSGNGKERLKGSGRSFHDCDLFAVTQHCKTYLEKFGGHQSAIGLSLQQGNLEAFRSSLQKAYASQNYTRQPYNTEIVGELDFSLISGELVSLMKQYEPFGEANTVPKFISYNVRIADVNTMGKEHNHLRFSFEQGGFHFTGVKFKTTEVFEPGSEVTIMYTVNEQYFRGRNSLQLLIENIT